MDLLYYLVNSRYQDRKITVFTTNYVDRAQSTPDSGEFLADRVSRRIRSRLFEMCRKVELRGGDYRKERFGDPRYERHA
jgi:DNA replication protein DnaC